MELSLDDLLSQDIQIVALNSVNQWWYHNGVFDYMNSPQPEHMLTLFTMGDSGTEFTYTSFDGKVLIPQDGDILYTPKGYRYRKSVINTKNPMLNSNRSHEYITNIVVKFQLNNSKGDELCLSEEMMIFYNLQRIHRCQYLIHQLCNLYLNSRYSQMMFKSRLYELINLLLEHQDSTSERNHENQAIIQPAINYITNNISDHISIDELAGLCRMSEVTFRRHFLRVTGMSPSNYWMRVRIEKAEQLLTGADVRISDIADALGFYDSTYFCKKFRQFTGMTPKEYRNSQS